MANIRKTLIDSLASQLAKITGIGEATRQIHSADEQEKKSPYIGIMAGNETVDVITTTKIRKRLPIQLFLITTQARTDVEELIDKIRDEVAKISLGNNVLYFQIDTVNPTVVQNIATDKFAYSVVNLTVLYYNTIGAA
jgi:hypothetical protein